nr:hypothetical protein KS05_26490 [Rhizobium brockwellii]
MVATIGPTVAPRAKHLFKYISDRHQSGARHDVALGRHRLKLDIDPVVVAAWYDLEHFFGLSGEHRKLSGIVVAKVVQRRIKFRLEFHELHCVPHAPNLRGRRYR